MKNNVIDFEQKRKEKLKKESIEYLNDRYEQVDIYDQFIPKKNHKPTKKPKIFIEVIILTAVVWLLLVIILKILVNL